MNKDRRKRILDQQDALDRALDVLTMIRDNLVEIKDEEEEAYDNMPESLQDGERGITSQTAIENLDQVIDAISNLVDDDQHSPLDEAMN
jgi:hypothetical protein